MQTPTFNEINQSEEDKKKLLEFANHGKGFLLLAGSNGSGKSYAAEAIYAMHTPYQLPQHDADLAIFITVAELKQEWLAEETKKHLLEKLKKTIFLVLDDLGTGIPSEAFNEFLYVIIDYRWRNRDALKTIITTNKPSPKIREMFGDAILSRIASGIVMRWDHPDRRNRGF